MNTIVNKNSVMNNSNNTTTLRCPNCGQAIAIPQHEHHTSGMCLGKDSGLGNVYLTPEEGGTPMGGGTRELGNSGTRELTKLQKAQMRLKQMRGIGLNTKNYSIKGSRLVETLPDGTEREVKFEDDCDEALKAVCDLITENGYVKHNKLFRRHILSQVFRAIRMTSHGYGWCKDIPTYVRRMGYSYMLKMLIEEFRVQGELKSDTACYEPRRRWWNGILLSDIIEALYMDLQAKAVTFKIRKCKGRKYVRLHGLDVFTDEVNEKVLRPLADLSKRAKRTSSPKELCNIAKEFKKFVKQFGSGSVFKIPNAYIDAWKGSGAYYTLQNLVLWHGVVIKTEDNCTLKDKEAMDYIDGLAAGYSAAGMGWKLWGFMKEAMEQNGIDPTRKGE